MFNAIIGPFLAMFIVLLLLGLLVGLVHKLAGACAVAIVGLVLVGLDVSEGDLFIAFINLLATASAAGLLYRRVRREQLLQQEVAALSQPKP